ncbi:MAG: haloacid dehalogenase-like hydrolase [Pseudomonadota bacterium]
MSQQAFPLVVDLDGTLIRNDVTFESMRLFTQGKPWRFLAIAWWFLRGRAYLKQELAKRVTLDFAELPYRRDLLRYLRREHEQGRLLALATAADQRYALGVAKYLGIFAEVYASDGKTNLKSHAKARVLVRRFGVKKFAYAGNSTADLAVWEKSAQAIPVGVSERVQRRLKKLDVIVE